MKSIFTTVTGISGTSVDDVLTSIQYAEKTRMFISSYETVFNTAEISEQAAANITSIFNSIDEKVSLPTSQFQIEQIVRYIASQTINEVNMGEYASFDELSVKYSKCSIKTTLSAITSIGIILPSSSVL